jgi:ABC-type transport system involved in multi-copper enzyme maturation permease subunit
MISLLWKDYRLNRPLLILCATVCGLLYLVGVGTQIAATWPGLPSSNDWAGMLVSYGAVAMYLTICFAGLFGGHAIACERGDRTAHFLACLPPTKLQILASKFIVSAGATVGLWGWVLLTRYMIPSALGRQLPASDEIVTGPGVASVCVLTFGVGWAASAILGKSTIPILVALISPVVVSIGLILVGTMFRIPQVRVSEWSNLVSLGTGLLALFAGTWYYCRRIEP